MKSMVYVEGGGQQRKTLDDCRRGFGQLFEKVLPTGHRPRVIACGDRDSAFRDFRRDLGQGQEAFHILLVDSEGPVNAQLTSWAHLRNQDGWEKPKTAREDQAHLMVQCMESWFLADRQALTGFYGKGFLATSLPRQENVEKILKRDVERALCQATQGTQKRSYHKTRHGFDLLAKINPEKLRGASKRARRLFEVLEEPAQV